MTAGGGRAARGTVHGHATQAQRAASIYAYVDLDVPAGARGLSVHLELDRTAGVIDLGVFAPDGSPRGYSGGARDAFTITEDVATPGYLPGPVPAGRWQVLLGLHRVPPDGLPWTVRWTTDPAPPPAEAPPPPRADRPGRRTVPATPGRRWVPGDLHAHTWHSDGRQTIDELAHAARRRGLDFLAVSDHNTVSHHPHLGPAGQRQGVLLVPAQEVTTDAGHANCFGAVPWVDFREPADAWVAHARNHGGVLSVNHPLEGDCAWRLPLSAPPSHVEAWHGTWDGHDLAPLRWWAQTGAVPVGGTDVHLPQRGDVPGLPTTWVEVEGSPTQAADVVTAIAAGRTAISAAPDAPVLVRTGGRLVAVDGGGTRLVAGGALLAAGSVAAAPGEPVTAAEDDLGPRPGWHVLVGRDDRVVALSP